MTNREAITPAWKAYEEAKALAWKACDEAGKKESDKSRS